MLLSYVAFNSKTLEESYLTRDFDELIEWARPRYRLGGRLAGVVSSEDTKRTIQHSSVIQQLSEAPISRAGRPKQFPETVSNGLASRC